MHCAQPSRGQYGVLYPCRQCNNCHTNDRRKKVGRFLLEAMHSEGTFFTLTYDEDHVPWCSSGWLTLNGDHATAFRKAFRKKYPGRAWFLIGEYGERFARPHYHGVSFIPPSEFQPWVTKQWSHGHVDVGTLKTGAMFYVSHYVTKKMTRSDDPRLQGRQPEKSYWSRRPFVGEASLDILTKSLKSDRGRRLIDSNGGDVPRNFRVDGKKWPLDYFIRTKLRERLGITEWRRAAPVKRLREQVEQLQTAITLDGWLTHQQRNKGARL